MLSEHESYLVYDIINYFRITAYRYMTNSQVTCSNHINCKFSLTDPLKDKHFPKMLCSIALKTEQWLPRNSLELKYSIRQRLSRHFDISPLFTTPIALTELFGHFIAVYTEACCRNTNALTINALYITPVYYTALLYCSAWNFSIYFYVTWKFITVT